MDNFQGIYIGQEGKEVKNFFHFSQDDHEDVIQKSCFKKPPVSLRPKSIQSCFQSKNGKPVPRVRSASTGRDKRSELQARYWAFLFGNLQRSVNEIYQTVECYENLPSCQEAILVLENYIRDFKALAEWFKVSWDYEATPLPQRPQSLAWEVRKSNPAPRVRGKQLSSPAISGKSSPSISGKISPCPTIGEVNKILPKKNYSSTESLNKIKGNIKTSQQNGPVDVDIIIEPKEHNEFAIQTPFVLKLDQYTQTNLDDENLTLAEYLEKYCTKKEESNVSKEEPVKEEASPKPKEEEKHVKPLPATTSQPIKPTTRPPISNARLPPKVQPRLVTKTSQQQSSSVLVRKSATVSQLAQNTSRPVNLPTKSATVSNLSSSAVVKRPSPAVNSSLKNKVMPPNTASRLSARSKTMIEINNRKNIPTTKTAQPKFPCPRKLSKEDIDSSSSTLKASTDKLPTNRFVDSVKRNTESRKSEPKTLPSDSNNNDGWTMVKTKRRSSLHWATRFNQPSGYASLPSLTLLNEQQAANDAKTEKENAKTEELKQKAARKTIVEAKPKVFPIVKKPNPKVSSAPPVVKKPNVPEVKRPTTAPVFNPKPVSRQKSDLTGLKMKTLHKEFLRNEKLKDSQKLKSPPIPALLSSDIPLVSPISITPPEEISECDELLPMMSKIDMNIQTNLISPSIQSLYMNINGEPHGIRTDIQLSSCDEFEEKEDLESDEDQRKLLEEQESLERQIRELQNTEIDIDTETDETDCETIIDLEDNESTTTLENQKENAYQDEEMTLEMRYESVLSDMSWIERIETLETLKAIVARHPGRAQQLHAKLSSPSRRRSLQEIIKKFQARQTRAKEKRESLQKEKASKIQQLLARVEDVKTAKQQLIDKKRHRMEERLQKAYEKRTQYLKDKIKKAHDEEEKLKEIAFIKNLEQQNKMIDYFESCKEQECRLQDLEQERQRRAEEKAAKEAAVERRRMVIEQERQKRLEQMSDIRREREKRVGQKQEQKQKLRLAIAKEKARDREERLQAIQAQQLATTEELQRKIKQKQIESSKNREEIIEHIRQRASELAIPSRNSDENSATKSNGDENDREDDSISTSASEKGKENHVKANKKRLKKLKQKMRDSAEIYLAEMQPLSASLKRQSQVPKLLKSITKDDGPVGIERPLGQLLRLIAKAEVADFQGLWLLDGLKIVSDIVQKGMESNSQVSKRAIVISVQLYRNACSSCPQICRHAILGNSIAVLFDALVSTLKAPEEKSPLYPVELSTELILACTVALSSNSLKQDAYPKVLERLPDLISYTVSLGLLDVIMKRFCRIREPVENQQGVVLSLLATLGLLTKLAELCPRGPVDSTRFLYAVKVTELFGTINLLYSTVIPIGQCIPPRTISLAAASFNLLSTLASLDNTTFQDVLSEENLSLKFLDVISVLLQYCGPKAEENNETKAVIIDLITTLGFFCANNTINQDLLTSVQSSLVIKCLTKLPKKFDMVLYPTLVTIIHDNSEAKSILCKDFDVESLLEYSKSDMAKKNKIVSLLEQNTEGNELN